MRKSIAGIAGVALMVAAAGCTPSADDNRSAVIVTAAFDGPGGDDPSAIGYFSDVVSNSLTTTDDFWTVTLRSTPKSPTADLSELYRINFLAYEVRFSRPDGRNEPGVDVPFPFTSAIGGTLPVEGTASLNTLIITKEMKLQPPLRNLWFGDGQRIFATAHFTIFGRDLVDNAVSATASAVVVFEDIPG